MTEHDETTTQEPTDEAHPDLEVTDEQADDVKGGGVKWGATPDKGPQANKWG